MRRRWTLAQAKRLRDSAVKVGLRAAGKLEGISGERVRQVLEEHKLSSVLQEGTLALRSVSRKDVLAAAKAPSMRAAAKQLGREQITVHKLFEREGVEAPDGRGRRRKTTDEQVRKAYRDEYVKKGLSLQMVAELLGYQWASTLQVRFKKLGLATRSVPEGVRTREKYGRGRKPAVPA